MASRTRGGIRQDNRAYRERKNEMRNCCCFGINFFRDCKYFLAMSESTVHNDYIWKRPETLSPAVAKKCSYTPSDLVSIIHNWKVPVASFSRINVAMHGLCILVRLSHAIHAWSAEAFIACKPCSKGLQEGSETQRGLRSGFRNRSDKKRGGRKTMESFCVEPFALRFF
ncbi:hypothetical protein PUMCH_004054 [Australozyma saopauloensis]|uniref:Uncharacterized protein n=1 Tax=Australozyma saopauloensis TaxID=291208 RepID=A0AAX4HE20_9ASCO|nr:hypothetical protein PUMCH_004054 [[Candida] saopauloensis]